MTSLFKIDGKISILKSFFIFILAVWVASIPFKNALYQTSFATLDLMFLVHLVVCKNYKILKEILLNVKFMASCFALICLAMIISNAINTEILSTKSWRTVAFFPFRYGLVFLLLCYFYRLKFFTKNNLKWLIMFGIFCVACGGLWQISQNSTVLFDVKMQLIGFLSNRNGFGLFMGLGFICSVMFVKNSVLKAFCALFFLALLLFSYSRAAWVGAGVAFLAYAVLNVKNIKLSLAFALFFTAFVGIIYFSFESVQIRFFDLISANSTHRTDIWAYCLDKISQNPIFGLGIDTFRNLPNSPVLKHYSFNSPHNIFLESLLYTGTFGFIVYFTAVGKNFISAFKTRNFDTFVVFVYFFVVCQFDHGAYMTKEVLSYIVIFSFFIYAKDES